MWEIEVLDALQNIHTPWLDKLMVAITSLGNAGILWIVLAVVRHVRGDADGARRLRAGIQIGRASCRERV